MMTKSFEFNANGVTMAVTGAILAAFGYGLYKMIKLGVEADEREAKRKEELKNYIYTETTRENYKELIRNASIYNKNIDPHQRNLASDILNDSLYYAKNANDYDDFDERFEDFIDILSVFQGDDKEAMMAMLDRRLQIEENRKIKAQREHELAVAKATGERDINIAKIAADAETTKAELYSSAIKSGAELIKEAKNERNEKTDD